MQATVIPRTKPRILLKLQTHQRDSRDTVSLGGLQLFTAVVSVALGKEDEGILMFMAQEIVAGPEAYLPE